MAADALNCAHLRKIFENVFPDNKHGGFHTDKGRNRTRMRRALTWLEAANQFDTSAEERFIFMWVSFNAVYGDEPLSGDEEDDSKKMMGFLGKVKRHGDPLLRAVISEHKKDFIAVLENRYMNRFFWKWVREQEDNKEYEHGLMFYHDHWNRSDTGSKFLKKNRWLVHDTGHAEFLRQVFWHLYTLRNQLLHGGATYRSSINRDSIKAGNKALALLLPVILEIIFTHIKNNPETNEWGRVWYPHFLPDAG